MESKVCFKNIIPNIFTCKLNVVIKFIVFNIQIILANWISVLLGTIYLLPSCMIVGYVGCLITTYHLFIYCDDVIGKHEKKCAALSVILCLSCRPTNTHYCIPTWCVTGNILLMTHITTIITWQAYNVVWH